MKEEKLLDLLKVMLKNSRLSDRELARLMNLSQPTVSRVRTALEKQGILRLTLLSLTSERWDTGFWRSLSAK